MFTILRDWAASLSGRFLGRLLTSERGVHRFRMAGLAISANILSKALSFAVVIYSTRVALDHLGAERFGIWVTISSVAILLSFMDLGLSNALVTRVASLYASPTKDGQSAQVVTSGILGLTLVGLLAAILLAASFAAFPIQLCFKGADADAIHEARVAGYAFAFCFGLSLPAQGLYRVYAGLQRGWMAHTTAAVASILSLLMVAACPLFDAPMWVYLFATFGIQQFVAVVLVKDLVRRGILSYSQLSVGRLWALRGDALVSQGKMFLLIQIAVAVVWGSNQIILSSAVGPAETAAFSVVQRLFMVVAMPLAVLNAPLWAMYADAQAHGENGFIRGTLIRSMTLSLFLSVGGALVITLASADLIRILSNGRVSVSSATIGLVAIWTIFEACGNAFAMYLNGVGAVRPQAITAIAYVVISVPLKIAGAYYFGLNGMLVVMIASYILFTILPLLTVFRRECLAPLARSNLASGA